MGDALVLHGRRRSPSRRYRRWRTVAAKSEIEISAPTNRVLDLLLDCANWPQIFPFVRRVQVLADHPGRTVAKVATRLGLEVTHTIGVVSPREIETESRSRHFTATLVHRVETEGDKTRYIVLGNVRFRGVLALAGPALAGLVQWHIRRSMLEPMRGAVEGPRYDNRTATWNLHRVAVERSQH